MTFNNIETKGRRMLVEFTCCRCKTTQIKTLKDCMDEEKEHYGNIENFRPPNGWEYGRHHFSLFCPKCKKEYEEFMRSGESDG